jgi:hypothetical protein
MSSSVAEAPEAVRTETSVGFRHSLDPAETEFDYRPIPMSAMVGGVLAVVSVASLLAWLAIPVAVVAAVICLISAIRIMRSQGEFAGKWLAVGGLAFSITMGVAGVLLTMHRYKNELPPGFERKSFARDISAQGVGVQEVGGRARLMIPESVQALEGKRLYLKGFMYPTERQYQLTSFILCKDNAQCCFGGEPALQDMIGVVMQGSNTATHDPSLTGVAGTLKLNRDYHGGKLEPIYILEAEQVAPAQTSL